MTDQSTDQTTALTRLIEEAIDKGADTAEEINRAILDLPITVLDSLGMENTSNEVKKVQDSTIGAIYQLVHDINHKVADLATELLEQAGVAIAPGVDFGTHAANEHVRFAYTQPISVLREGVERIAKFLGK